ncbi:MAG: hypothetical protein HYX21_00025 [Candidatus Yanofskybacteria bacterium]|nr:hypothetical protein [Candidatus Yanofskybacteria bacterium]
MKYYNNDVPKMEASDFADYSSAGWFVGCIISFVISFLFLVIGNDTNKVRIYKKALFFSVADAQEQLKPLLYDEKSESVRNGVLLGVTDGSIIREAYQEKVVFEELFAKASVVAKIKTERKIDNAPLGQTDKEALKLPARLEMISRNFLKVEFLDTMAIRGILEKGNKPPEVEFAKFGLADFLALVLLITQFGGAISFFISCFVEETVWYRFDWKSGWLYLLFAATIPGAVPVFAVRGLVVFLSPDFWKQQFQNRRKAKEESAKKNMSLGSFKLDFPEAKESRLVLERLQKRLKDRVDV